MTRCAGWTARSRGPARSRSSGGAAGSASHACSSNVAASRRPLCRGRSIRAAGAAAAIWPGRSPNGSLASPDVEYPHWRSFLTRLSAEAEQAGWRGPVVLDELPYLLAADPTPGRRPAELAGPPGAATDAGRLRVEPAYDAQRDPRRCRSPVRPGCRSLCGASLAARVSRGGFPVRRLRRSGLHICAVGRDASLLGARRTIRGRSRNRGGRPDPRPRGTVAWRARSAAAGGDPPGDRATPRAGRHRQRRAPGQRDRGSSGQTRLRPVEAAGVPDGDGARTPGDAFRERTRGRASGASTGSTIPFCGCGSGWSLRIGGPLPPRPARRGCTTGGGTGQASNPWLGRSCAEWPCPCCTARIRRWRGSARGSPRKDTGEATRRNWTSSRARSMAGGCWSGEVKWSNEHGRRLRGRCPRRCRELGPRRRRESGPRHGRRGVRALFVPSGAAPRAGAGVHVIDARAVMSVLR